MYYPEYVHKTTKAVAAIEYSRTLLKIKILLSKAIEYLIDIIIICGVYTKHRYSNAFSVKCKMSIHIIRAVYTVLSLGPAQATGRRMINGLKLQG